MANNIHISYTLHSPGQNYRTVTNIIKSLGDWAHVHDSFWIIKSNRSAAAVRDLILPELDSNDSLYVVDSTNNECAWFANVKIGEFLNLNWNR